MHFYDKKDTDYKQIMQGKYKNGKIGEVYDWIQNLLIVLNIIFCLLCSTML